MQDLYSKYKFIDTRLVTSKQNLKGKLPEIKKTLEAVQYLSKKVIYEPIYYDDRTNATRLPALTTR